jgi:N-acetylmuramoyl-L-alanine amidase
MKIVISSGHAKYCRGASGYIDEVDEARRVVDRVFEYLSGAGVGVTKFHDDVSDDQNENLNRIVNFHNSKTRDLDVSVHFNAYETTANPMGTECLYVTKDALAQQVATAISNVSSLKNRGPKKRTDLFFLNNTEMPAILIEVCFVDSQKDVELYENNFDEICVVIAETIGDVVINGDVEPSEPEPDDGVSELIVIEPVSIWQMFGGGYVTFISDLDICNDGTGPSHGDPHHQSMTAYNPYLNADKDKYVVIPPQVRSLLPDKAMGCRGRLTNLKTGDWTPTVVGEIGPDDKTGEASYAAAICVNPGVTYNSGDESLIYLYELWPGVPAVVDGKQYKLQ